MPLHGGIPHPLGESRVDFLLFTNGLGPEVFSLSPSAVGTTRLAEPTARRNYYPR